MLKAVIIDDETKGRSILRRLLEEYCKNVVVLGEAEDVLSGVKVINMYSPDIVFLDIEMPNYSGFKLIDFFGSYNFEVVFTTAYAKYAMQAFKVSAAGYLLKPIDIDELLKIIARVERTKAFVINKNQAKTGQKTILSSDENRVVLPAADELIYLYLDQIYYLESDGRFTNIVLKDTSKVKTTKSLKECQQLFSNLAFIRIHRSYMINLAYIKRFNRGRDSFVLMDNGNRVDVGKNYKEELTEVISFFLK